MKEKELEGIRPYLTSTFFRIAVWIIPMKGWGRIGVIPLLLVETSFLRTSLAVGNEQIKSSKYSPQVEKTVATKIYKSVTNYTVFKETGIEGGLVHSSSGGYQAVDTAGRSKGSRVIHGVRTSASGLYTNASEGMWSLSDASRWLPKQGRRNVRRSEFRVSVDRRQLEASASNSIHRQE